MSDPLKMGAAKRRKEERRAQAELEQDARRVEAERTYEGSRIAVAINAAERRAQHALQEALPAGLAQQAWSDLYVHRSARSIRGLDGQRALQATSRPINADGAQGFHFKLTSIARGDELKASILSPSSVKRFRATAHSHQRYVEREDALEEVLIIGAAGQQYIEDDAKIEAVSLSADQLGSIRTASFGNIPGDAQERAAFWKLVEVNERKPSHTITFDPAADASITFEARLLCNEAIDLPEAIRAIILGDERTTFEVDTDVGMDLIDLFVQAGQLDGFRVRSSAYASSDSPAATPLMIQPGRGGVVQQRIVAELPTELSPLQRLRLVENFCKPYAEAGLKFWAVVHAPVDTNDTRNFHMHANVYDRPCAQVRLDDGRQVWDFAYVVDVYNPERGRSKPVWPFYKDKIREMGKSAWVNTERARFANVVNESLKAAAVKKLLDPRTYQAMGIDAPTRDRVAPHDYAQERKGQRTDAGDRLAEHEWRLHRNELVATERALVASMRDRIAELTQRATESSTTYVAQRLAEIRAAYERQVQDEIDRLAAIYVHQRLISRARLKSEKMRDASERAVLKVAAELEALAKQSKARIALERKITDIAEADIESVLPFDILAPLPPLASETSPAATRGDAETVHARSHVAIDRALGQKMKTAATSTQAVTQNSRELLAGSNSQTRQGHLPVGIAQPLMEAPRPPPTPISLNKRPTGWRPTNDRPTHANIAAVRRRVILQRQIQQARSPLQKPKGIGRS
jgi:uncharacterized protein (DUF2267 family)